MSRFPEAQRTTEVYIYIYQGSSVRLQASLNMYVLFDQTGGQAVDFIPNDSTKSTVTFL